jgi:transposase
VRILASVSPALAAAVAMIPVLPGVRVWLAVGWNDMRKGINGLALQAQQALGRDPHAGDLYVFRGARGVLLNIVWHDSTGMSLYAKRLGLTGSIGGTRFSYGGRRSPAEAYR